MKTSDKARRLIDTLNHRILGTSEVEWNTVGAFHLTSYKPGAKRIYVVERNLEHGVDRQFAGHAKEVYDYMRGVIDGTAFMEQKK
jgi:hypothetical protein